MELEKANRAIKITGKVSPLQHKVFNSILHNIRARFKETVEDGFETIESLHPQIIQIPFEWVSTGDTRSGNNKEFLEKCVSEIMKIDFREVDGNDVTLFHAVEFVQYNWESRKVLTRPTKIFHDLCKEHFESGGFVTLPVSELLPLMSTYSLKFYELFKQFSEVGRSEVVKPVEWLRDWLNVGNKYALFSDFRKWVLESAHKEITEKTNLRYEFELIKRGRVVESVRFFGISYNLAPRQVAQIAQAKPSPEPTEIEVLLIRSGVEGEAVQQLAQLYPDPAFIRSLIAGADKAKNKAGYIISKAGERWREWKIKQDAKTAPKTGGKSSGHSRTPEKLKNDRKEAEIVQKRIDEYESTPEKLKQAVRAYRASPDGGAVLFFSDARVYATIADRLHLDPSTGEYAVQQDFTEIPTRGMGVKRG